MKLNDDINLISALIGENIWLNDECIKNRPSKL